MGEQPVGWPVPTKAPRKSHITEVLGILYLLDDFELKLFDLIWSLAILASSEL